MRLLQDLRVLIPLVVVAASTRHGLCVLARLIFVSLIYVIISVHEICQRCSVFQNIRKAWTMICEMLKSDIIRDW